MTRAGTLIHRIANSLRNRVRRTLFGRLWAQLLGHSTPTTLRIVCATRLTEKEFWTSSALGRSLNIWRLSPALSFCIHCQNTQGLPSVYNPHLQDPQGTDVLLFVHDDVWLDDPQWLAKVLVALDRYDIVGVAGNTRISLNQPAWLFKAIENDQFIWDTDFLSGTVGHGQGPGGNISIYGATPARCELLDGVFLAVRSCFAHQSNLRFDERFTFHFYDMDFCRSARSKGLALGTWPIHITHQSVGAFGTTAWKQGHMRYVQKWHS